MAFYENTIVAKQDLAEKDLKSLKEKYNEIINNYSRKVIKIEKRGILSIKNKIKNYKALDTKNEFFKKNNKDS